MVPKPAAALSATGLATISRTTGMWCAPESGYVACFAFGVETSPIVIRFKGYVCCYMTLNYV